MNETQKPLTTVQIVAWLLVGIVPTLAVGSLVWGHPWGDKRPAPLFIKGP